MKVVLSAIARMAELRPVRPERERVVRRAITLTPNRGAEVTVRRRAGAEPDGGAAEPAVAAA
jgi:hypothetical protein